MRTESLVDAPTSRPRWHEETVPLRLRNLRDWQSLVLDAYAAQPTLSLTVRQAQRLWSMDAPTCQQVLDGLVRSGVLTRTVDERYCRSDYVGAVDPAGLP
jgi:hypothetical protein